MSHFNDLDIFINAVDLGSLSAAARQLNMTPSAVSVAVKRLETRLGVRLLVRSTRSQRLTDEGRRYLDSARIALAALAEGEEAILRGVKGLTGVLQISAPSDLGRSMLLGWLDEFRQIHPHIQIQLLLNDRPADLFREPVDIALRYGIPEDSSLVALPILPEHPRTLCASPAYLARHGEPTTPQELAQHNALLYQRKGRHHTLWRFTRHGVVEEVRVRGNLSTDDGDVARRWALSGQGIVYKSALDVIDDLRAGRLIKLLPEWQGDNTPLNLLCPHRAQVSERVKVFQQFLQQRCVEKMAGY
jgi:DNA-binding transcriptional LysR family regulator